MAAAWVDLWSPIKYFNNFLIWCCLFEYQYRNEESILLQKLNEYVVMIILILQKNKIDEYDISE